MTMLQNQTSDSVANVLHDQGVPNTLDGIGLPTETGRLGPLAVIVLAAVALLSMVAIVAFGAT